MASTNKKEGGLKGLDRDAVTVLVMAILILSFTVGLPVGLALLDYNKPFDSFTVTGELVSVKVDYWGATRFVVQQSNLRQQSCTTGRVPINIDYSLIGQQVIIVYQRDGACYIQKLTQEPPP